MRLHYEQGNLRNGMKDDRDATKLLQAIEEKFELHNQINEIATDPTQLLREHDTCLIIANLLPSGNLWDNTKDTLTSATILTFICNSLSGTIRYT